MKKVYELKGLDCPNCSAKIEKEVGKLSYVSDSVVNLMKQTITVEFDGSEKQIFFAVREIVKRHEPDVEVSEKTADLGLHHDPHHEYVHMHHHDEECTRYHDHQGSHMEKENDAFRQENSCCHGECHDQEDGKESVMVKRLVCGGIIYVIGLLMGNVFHLSLTAELTMLIAAYLILGYDVILTALRNISHGKVFDEHFLMSISTIGAFVIGEYPEAVAVMLFYQIGEFCQDKAVDSSRRSISGLMEIKPDSANIMKNGQIVTVPADNIRKGQEIIVRPGERIPLDGIILTGKTSLDTKALTGESVPRDADEGDLVLSGSINLNGVITVKVEKTFGESTASKIIDMVENASARKAPTEHFITKFAAVYTPIVVFMAAALAIIPPILIDGNWVEWIHRAFVFLVVSCPCAFVIAIPLTFFGGIGAAARKGILVKGGNYLEALNKVSTIVFDKTGTLSKGVFKVVKVLTAEGASEEEILEMAAHAESLSKHPIAESIVKAYGKSIDSSRIENLEELSGHGVKAVIDGRSVIAGNAKLMSAEQIKFISNDEIGTKIYVARDNEYLGCIIIADELKQDSRRAIDELRKLGVEKMVMLTGDNEKIAEHAAKKLGLDEYYAELLPGDKVEKLEMLDKKKKAGSKLVFVGDGINDAPVLARADIGISMGGLGADAAIEAADTVLMTDEPSKIAEAVRIARRTRKIVLQNIVFALAVKVVFLVLGALGIAGMWEAVFGDVGVTLIAVANSLRMLK